MKAIPNIRLKSLLLACGVTQRDLSFSIGLDESRLSRIIRGYERATPEIQQAIAEFFKLDLDEIFLKVMEPFSLNRLRSRRTDT